ncbi:MAG: hypothetical protein ACE5FO_02660 [Parvularculaceae bacterium]
MKFEHIKKLLSAAETKKRLETTELAALRAARRALHDEAERVESTARQSRLAHDETPTGSDLTNYGRNLDQLYSTAGKLRNKAADYETPIKAQANEVRAALRRKMAWESLFDAALRNRRKELEKKDEQIREETSLKALAARRRGIAR